MEDDEFSNEEAVEEDVEAEGGSLDSQDEGFIKGYSEEEEVSECAECGLAVKEEKKVVREIEGESFTFCSEDCAKDFEEGCN
ncbi:hypothetical protein J4437_06760 [Candidatus Woesearchaeota archaeon]|nr:hypothetical protein [Candidatus Woesearchaeota archaeon]